jgi:uncharacterized protein VirK/YbjX
MPFLDWRFTGMITIIPAIVLVLATLSILKALSIVCHEEGAGRKTGYGAFLRVLAALRILLFPKSMLEFHSMELTSKLRNPARKHDPLYFMIHNYHISKRFSLRQRVRVAMDHHQYELHNFDNEYAAHVYRLNGLLLWERTVDDLKFELVLIATDDNRHEGDLSVILYVNNTRLGRMSYC